MTEVERLERELRRAKEKEHLMSLIENARCPLCGGKLTFEQTSGSIPIADGCTLSAPRGKNEFKPLLIDNDGIDLERANIFLAKLFLAEADEMVEDAVHNFARSYTAQLKRENERLRELIGKSDETDNRDQ